MQTIRLSIGSASVLGLKTSLMETAPTTCYMMTANASKCLGNCGFCPQRRESDPHDTEKLSRIQWPEFSWEVVISELKMHQNSSKSTKFKRICLQSLNYAHFFEDVQEIISIIRQFLPEIPISTAIPPISKTQLLALKKAGLTTVCFALDACTPALFQDIKGINIKGPYKWDKHLQTLDTALEVFGKSQVSTHLIVGLGESEREMINCLHMIISKHILPGIFFFTPIKGTPMSIAPRKPIIQFRHVQIARFLMLRDIRALNRFQFSEQGELISISYLSEEELKEIVNYEIAFRTAGCPDCNRPFYTARPGDEQDGYPRSLTPSEKDHIYSELLPLLDKNPTKVEK